jgi:MFS family permease
MATINASIVIISLPAIFRGIGLNALAPGNVSYLLWMLMGFLLVSAVLVVSLGRLGDMYGRVKVYNLGFVVFTLSSLVLSVDPWHAAAGALWLILFRVVQGVGGAMLFANSTAILTGRVPLHPARDGPGDQPGRGHRRVVPRPADRRRARRVGLARGVLGEHPHWHPRHGGPTRRCTS